MKKFLSKMLGGIEKAVNESNAREDAKFKAEAEAQAAKTIDMETVAAVTEEEAPKVVQQEVKLEGRERLLAEAEAAVDGSAIKSFLPIFLQTFFNKGDDLNFTLIQGNEMQTQRNPSMDMLAAHSQANWIITADLDPHDVASAIVLRVTKKQAEEIEFTKYPTVILDLGVRDELVYVYRLTEVIDRQDSPQDFKGRTILEGVMAEQMGATVENYNRIPVAAFRFPKASAPVRILRYSRAYALDELIEAFNAERQIENQIKEPGEVKMNPEEELFNAVFVKLISEDFTKDNADAAITTVARALVSGGMSLKDRLMFAPELYSRFMAFEPQWVAAQGITEKDVLMVFSNEDSVQQIPENQTTLKKTTV